MYLLCLPLCLYTGFVKKKRVATLSRSQVMKHLQPHRQVNNAFKCSLFIPCFSFFSLLLVVQDREDAFSVHCKPSCVLVGRDVASASHMFSGLRCLNVGRHNVYIYLQCTGKMNQGYLPWLDLSFSPWITCVFKYLEARTLCIMAMSACISEEHFFEHLLLTFCHIKTKRHFVIFLLL